MSLPFTEENFITVTLAWERDGTLRVEEIPKGIVLYVKEYPHGEELHREGCPTMPEENDPQVWHDDKGYYTLWGYQDSNVGDAAAYCIPYQETAP